MDFVFRKSDGKFITPFIGCAFMFSLSIYEITIGYEESNIEVEDFLITSTSDAKPVTMSWTDVDAVFWYFVNFGPTDKDKLEAGEYQNLNTTDMSYTLENLDPYTEYEIYIDGKTYLSGGDLVAKSNSVTISTK